VREPSRPSRRPRDTCISRSNPQDPGEIYRYLPIKTLSLGTSRAHTLWDSPFRRSRGEHSCNCAGVPIVLMPVYEPPPVYYPPPQPTFEYWEPFPEQPPPKIKEHKKTPEPPSDESLKREKKPMQRSAAPPPKEPLLKKETKTAQRSVAPPPPPKKEIVYEVRFVVGNNGNKYLCARACTAAITCPYVCERERVCAHAGACISCTLDSSDEGYGAKLTGHK
jgi:hypothetical protein